MTVVIEWPPGHPGDRPHRHSGPCFGYVLAGAPRFELEGEPERVIKAGEAFWEPGKPMLMFVDDEELAQRAHLRATRPLRPNVPAAPVTVP